MICSDPNWFSTNEYVAVWMEGIALIAILAVDAWVFWRQGQERKQQDFINKYFELLKMHRDNVAEIELKEERGRKVFVTLLRELRCIESVVRKTAATRKQQLANSELMHLSYYCLFFGVGPNSSRMLKMSLPEFPKDFVDALEEALNSDATKEEAQRSRGFQHVPFEGHQSRLGHYYRHLYQMVDYVHRQKLDIDKYQYVKTIRAQLSTHEQALLLVNSLTPIGKNWWTNGLITDYRIVQNIPREFFDSATELACEKLLKTGYFEWEEARQTLAASSESRGFLTQLRHRLPRIFRGPIS